MIARLYHIPVLSQTPQDAPVNHRPSSAPDEPPPAPQVLPTNHRLSSAPDAPANRRFKMTSEDQVAMSSSQLMFVMLRVQPSPNPIKVVVMVTKRQEPSQSDHRDEQQTHDQQTHDQQNHDQQTLHLVKAFQPFTMPSVSVFERRCLTAASLTTKTFTIQ
ncbi:hypothetical protein HK102_002637 [Quaeritorhiza haematococci]|nr:hypothetical protein HK102_002637 [Quaeritorhiza haematococci]